MDKHYRDVKNEVNKWMKSAKLPQHTKVQMWKLLKEEKKKYEVRIRKDGL